MSNNVYRVHPSIGMARVGNSEEFILAPETMAGMPVPGQVTKGGLAIQPGTESDHITSRDLRDAEGALKRQAARFRIYQYDDPKGSDSYPNGGGTEVRIGTTIEGLRVMDIVWTVHLANKKTNNYESADDEGIDAWKEGHRPPLRNPREGPDGAGIDRLRRLVIDPGPRAIKGADAAPVRFDQDTVASYGEGAKIAQQPRYPKSFPGDHFRDMQSPRGDIDTLGELRTDLHGRLLVLGAYGRASGWRRGDGSAYPLAADVNNNGWFDDVGDGPVGATLVLEDGSTREVHGGWAVVTDPSYAPQTLNVVSLWDDVYDTWIRKLDLRPQVYKDGEFQLDYRPAFDSEIFPFFQAASLQRWNTNLPTMAIRAHDVVGRIKASDDPADTILAGLVYIRDPNNPSEADVSVPLMPLSLGDSGKPFLSPSLTQYFWLSQWNEGTFEAGEDQPLGPGERLDHVTLANCLGGRFSPGIELTYIVRQPGLWEVDWKTRGGGPFRIRAKALDYSKLDPKRPFLSEGWLPLQAEDEGVEPGDTSKYMALPWHTDYNSCATHESAPNPTGSSTLFWSWPAQRPVAVYAAKDVRDGQLGAQRYSVRGLGTESADPADQGRYQERLDFIDNWPRIGTIMQASAIDDGVTYDAEHYLEVESQLDPEAVPPWPLNTLD